MLCARGLVLRSGLWSGIGISRDATTQGFSSACRLHGTNMPVECRNNLAPFLLTGPPCRSMPTQKAVQCMTGMSLRLPWSELERRPVAGQASITVSKQPKGGWPRRWAFVAARPKWLPTALPPVRYEPSPITRIGPSGPPSYCVGFGGPRSLASRPGPCWPNNRAFTSRFLRTRCGLSLCVRQAGRDSRVLSPTPRRAPGLSQGCLPGGAVLRTATTGRRARP